MKVLKIILSFFLCFSLSACSSEDRETEEQKKVDEEISEIIDYEIERIDFTEFIKPSYKTDSSNFIKVTDLANDYLDIVLKIKNTSDYSIEPALMFLDSTLSFDGQDYTTEMYFETERDDYQFLRDVNDDVSLLPDESAYVHFAYPVNKRYKPEDIVFDLRVTEDNRTFEKSFNLNCEELIKREA